MKIAILTPTFNYYSGIDRVAQDRAERLSKEGHKVTVFAFEAKIKPKGYKTIELGTLKSPNMERLRKLFFSHVSKNEDVIKKLNGYDEIISSNYPMDEYAVEAKKKYGTRYVAWFSGIHPGERIEEKLYMEIFKGKYYNCLRQANEIVCVSEFVKNELLKEAKLDVKKIKIRVQLNKIDTTRFNKNVEKIYIHKIHQISEKYDLKGKIVFLYVGRLSTSKRIDMLIKLFVERKDEFPQSKLMIVGEPTFKGYYQRLLKLADKDVIFTGFVKDEDLPAYYAISDIYVTTSSHEGYNLPAVEAQACGKPVIAFDVGAHKEIVNKKGTLIPEGDLDGFANSMIKYAKSI